MHSRWNRWLDGMKPAQLLRWNSTPLVGPASHHNRRLELEGLNSAKSLTSHRDHLTDPRWHFVTPDRLKTDCSNAMRMGSSWYSQQRSMSRRRSSRSHISKSLPFDFSRSQRS